MINSFIGTEEEKAAYNQAISQDTFLYAVTFNQQLGFLCEFLRSGSLKVKYRQIGYVFAVSRQKAQKYHIKFLRGEGIDGRPPILTPDELQIPITPTNLVSLRIQWFILRKNNFIFFIL